VENILKSPWGIFGIKLMACLLGAAIGELLSEWIVPFSPEYVASVILIAGGLYFGFFDLNPLPGRKAGLIKKLVALFLIIGGAWTGPFRPPEAQIAWEPYSDGALAEARRAGRPVLVDFFADWCGPCHEMERAVFSRRKVVEAAQEFVKLRADMTDKDSPAVLGLAEKFQVYGYPTVIFIGRDGQEKATLRLIGVEPASQFVHRIQAAK